jgi:hypothetical protein
MWIPKLGSFHLFQIIMTQIIRVKYSIWRKKAPKRDEKSSLKMKNFVQSEKFIKINACKQVGLLFLPIEMPQVQTSSQANHILYCLQAVEKKDGKGLVNAW